MDRVWLSIGGNMGDREHYLALARQELGRLPGCQVAAWSSLYRSAPWGKTDQDEFLNAALLLETELEPLSLLTACQDIERRAGRVRQEHWGQRTLDIDLIAWEGRSCASPELTLPHPWYKQRLFVLLPLLEIAGDLRLEAEGPGLAQLAAACEDKDMYVSKTPGRGEW